MSYFLGTLLISAGVMMFIVAVVFFGGFVIYTDINMMYDGLILTGLASVFIPTGLIECGYIVTEKSLLTKGEEE